MVIGPDGEEIPGLAQAANAAAENPPTPGAIPPYRKTHPLMPCGHPYQTGSYYDEDPTRYSNENKIVEWCTEGDCFGWVDHKCVFLRKDPPLAEIGGLPDGTTPHRRP